MAFSSLVKGPKRSGAGNGGERTLGPRKTNTPYRCPYTTLAWSGQRTGRARSFARVSKCGDSWVLFSLSQSCPITRWADRNVCHPVARTGGLQCRGVEGDGGDCRHETQKNRKVVPGNLLRPLRVAMTLQSPPCENAAWRASLPIKTMRHTRILMRGGKVRTARLA